MTIGAAQNGDKNVDTVTPVPDIQIGSLNKIKINDLLRIEDPRQYKLHLACGNEDGLNPLDVYVADRTEWIAWNEWKGDKNDWTRDFVFSLMEFYPTKDSWLFGGAFKVVERSSDHYRLEELPQFKKFEGRLLVSFHRYQGMRGRAYYLETYLDQFEVSEIIPQPYSGEAFCGYEDINHNFNVLEAIFENERTDWKAALSSAKGVYLISDKSNGKQYVGSAYGESGIWSRWKCYLGTGHGWNDELTKLIAEQGMAYARSNFKFSLLEIMAMTTSDETVIARECHWKNVLLTREHGYNRN